MEQTSGMTLRSVLRALECQLLWQRGVPEVGLLECYRGNGRVFLVQLFVDKDGVISGWEIYLPAHAGNDVRGTVAALERYLKGV